MDTQFAFDEVLFSVGLLPDEIRIPALLLRDRRIAANNGPLWENEMRNHLEHLDETAKGFPKAVTSTTKGAYRPPFHPEAQAPIQVENGRQNAFLKTLARLAIMIVILAFVAIIFALGSSAHADEVQSDLRSQCQSTLCQDAFNANDAKMKALKEQLLQQQQQQRLAAQAAADAHKKQADAQAAAEAQQQQQAPQPAAPQPAQNVRSVSTEVITVSPQVVKIDERLPNAKPQPTRQVVAQQVAAPVVKPTVSRPISVQRKAPPRRAQPKLVRIDSPIVTPGKRIIVGITNTQPYCTLRGFNVHGQMVNKGELYYQNCSSKYGSVQLPSQDQTFQKGRQKADVTAIFLRHGTRYTIKSIGK